MFRSFAGIVWLGSEALEKFNRLKDRHVAYSALRATLDNQDDNNLVIVIIIPKLLSGDSTYE